jgi:hypothetical protein
MEETINETEPERESWELLDINTELPPLLDSAIPIGKRSSEVISEHDEKPWEPFLGYNDNRYMYDHSVSAFDTPPATPPEDKGTLEHLGLMINATIESLERESDQTNTSANTLFIDEKNNSVSLFEGLKKEDFKDDDLEGYQKRIAAATQERIP